MEYVVGVSLAVAVSVFASLVGFDRDRAFYPTVMVVIAFYYALFAVIDGSLQVLLVESIAIGAFVGLAVLGFKRNLWLVVVALAAHGIYDFFHGHIVVNAGVPIWWPMFCLTYDIVAAACLAWLLKRSRVPVHAH